MMDFTLALKVKRTARFINDIDLWRVRYPRTIGKKLLCMVIHALFNLTWLTKPIHHFLGKTKKRESATFTCAFFFTCPNAVDVKVYLTGCAGILPFVLFILSLLCMSTSNYMYACKVTHIALYI